MVNTYYVDQQSTGIATRPSLRMKVLTTRGVIPIFDDIEIIPGVEDMQVQLGIDTSARNTPQWPPPNAGTANTYVNPQQIVLDDRDQIVSVRVWLLIRAEEPENGFVDDIIYEYGDRNQNTGITFDLNAAGSGGLAYQPSMSPGTAMTDVKHYRRLLISRTFQIRNAFGT
jgi:hypothetical protein